MRNKTDRETLTIAPCIPLLLRWSSGDTTADALFLSADSSADPRIELGELLYAHGFSAFSFLVLFVFLLDLLYFPPKIYLSLVFWVCQKWIPLRLA